MFAAAEPGFEASEVSALLSPVVGHPMAKAALEVALWDAQLRSEGRRLVDLLGGTRELVPAGVVVGVTRSAADTVAEVAERVSEGYQRVKLKIAPGADVVRVRAVREAFPALALQADGNGAYSGADATLFSKLDLFDLQCLEQPLPPDALLASAELAKQLRTRICLDEPLVSVGAVVQALDLGACSVVNLKVGRVGGLSEAMRVYGLCCERGVDLWVGGMLETGLGRAVNVAMASLPGFTMPGDLSASSRYWREDLTEPFELEQGCLRVPAGAGLGVVPRPEKLREQRRSLRLVKRGLNR
jgi:O-succinylbenzoate synthase